MVLSIDSCAMPANCYIHVITSVHGLCIECLYVLRSRYMVYVLSAYVYAAI